MSKTTEIAEKLIRAIDKAITPTPPARPQSDIECVACALVAMALPDLKRLLPDPMAEATRIEKAKHGCQEIIKTYSADAAMTGFLSQQRDFSAKAEAGALDVDNAWDLADWREDYENRRRAAQTAWQRLDTEQQPIREQIVEMLLEIHATHIANLVAEDTARYSRYGLTYVTSSLPEVLRSAQSYLENRGWPLVMSATK